MSDTFGAGVEFDSNPAASAPVETQPQPQPQQDTNGYVPTEDMVNPILQKIPVAHRGIVAPYLKEWDSGAQKKFKEYVEKLKPYESLGPATEIQKAVQFAKAFQADPEAMFRRMWEALQNQYGDDFDANLARILQLEMEQQMNDPNYDPSQQDFEPDPDEAFRQNVVEKLEAYEQRFQEMDSFAEEQEQMAQLDGVLEQMHTKFGEFDDDWVVTRLAAHGNIEQAMKEWQSMIAKHTAAQGAQRRVPPKVMGGQGGVPSGQTDTTKLRGQNRRQMVAAYLEGLQQ
jgi:hypothetical protein